ncbi:hydroxyethylthiazole kinase [Candidatus Latescibacterota bacterium]
MSSDKQSNVFSNEDREGVFNLLDQVRLHKPLIHHITNWVTIYDCANMTRMMGALPVMAHAREEVEDMALLASALVLNIGTLTPELIDAMVLAGQKANEKGMPVVLDAVGVGATKLRDDKAMEILNAVDVSIIKGNSSEIARLAGEDVVTKGVEATDIGVDPVAICLALAKRRTATVVMTGKQDIVTDGETVYLVNNGHSMMGNFVGTGCMAASVIGSFAAVEGEYAKAAMAGLVCYGVAGELAGENAGGPGSFKARMFDEVFNLDTEKINRMGQCEKYSASEY